MRRLVLLLQLTTLATSRITVARKDEGDWFSGIVTVQCHEISAYDDSGGCHCEHGLTFSTEHMDCRSYEGRGNQLYVLYHIKSLLMHNILR